MRYWYPLSVSNGTECWGRPTARRRREYLAYVDRIVVGSVTGITLVVFLASDILSVFFRLETLSPSLVFGVVFAGAFSERLLPGAVAAVLGDER